MSSSAGSPFKSGGSPLKPSGSPSRSGGDPSKFNSPSKNKSYPFKLDANPLALRPKADLQKMDKVSYKAEPDEHKSGTKTYLLVVNGCTDPCNSQIMGDWMGFCTIFREEANFGGDYWTVLDPDTHLDFTGRDDIKFGRTTMDAQTGKINNDFFESMVLYKKGEKEDNCWFKVRDPARIKGEVLGWIVEKSRIAKFGDAVVIVLCGHGNKGSGGGFVLGDALFLPKEYRQAIKAFKPDVQVSTIYNGCYSGYFHQAIEGDNDQHPEQRRFIHVPALPHEKSAADTLSPSGRYRNTPFARAWMKSMVGITLDRGRRQVKLSNSGKTLTFPDKKGVTIQSHFDSVEKAVTNRKNQAEVSHSQIFISDRHLAWKDMLSKALFRKYVDIDWNPEFNSLRRRIESHTTSTMQQASTKYIQPSQETIDEAMYLCHSEYKAFNAAPVPSDTGLYSTIMDQKRCKASLPWVLSSLYWRTRKQVAIFEVFAMIYQHGLFSVNALAIPINYSLAPGSVGYIMRMLNCFPKMADLSRPPKLGKWQLTPFEDALQWLAVIICRSCHDQAEVNAVISLIDHSSLLGKLDQKVVEATNADWLEDVQERLAIARKGKGKQKEVQIPLFFEHNPMENSADTYQHRIFALMLPAGQGMDILQLFHNATEKLMHIERVFKAFFDMSANELALHDGN
ncbi:MAG: hypothetical protein Q9213_005455 [Squamulea squamosa]